MRQVFRFRLHKAVHIVRAIWIRLARQRWPKKGEEIIIDLCEIAKSCIIILSIDWNVKALQKSQPGTYFLSTVKRTDACSRPLCYTLKFLALKKNCFSEKKKSSPKKYFFLPFFNATFQCGRYGVFKKNLKFFFDPEKVKKQASKVAHNRPRPSYFTVQPRPTAHSPELIFHIMKSRDQTSVLLSNMQKNDKNVG